MLEQLPLLGREREQERQPGRLFEVGLLGQQRVRAGRAQPRQRQRERDGQTLGVGGGLGGLSDREGRGNNKYKASNVPQDKT
jgi:hypothetical protein